MPRYEISSGRRSPATRVTLLILLLILLFGIRSFSSYAIEIEWWKELGQLNTWFSMLYYSIAPVTAATLLAFAALWISHARALKFAGTRLAEHRLYSRISTVALLLIGWFIAAGAIDNWTVVRFAGSRGLPPPPPPGTTPSSTSHSPSISSICRSIRCCAVIFWQ